VLYFKSFSITFNNKKINFHVLLPVLPKGFLIIGEEDKISFSAENKENILSVGHETKYVEEGNTIRFSLFQT